MRLADTQLDFLGQILATPAPTVSEGMRVYHHAYRARLAGAMAETYAQVWAWLGDETFNSEVRAYVEQHPSSQWSLDDYGQDFAGFLAQRFPDDPEIAELAWLDSALRQAFAAKDADLLDGAALTQVSDWETVRFVLNPALHHRAIRSNAPALWRALSKNETPPEVLYFEETSGLCVWKTALASRFRTLEADEYALICALAAGQGFAAACETLMRDAPDRDLTAQIGAWLGQWLAEGLITGLDTTETTA
ncbi:MAG: DNA-binding domain-containing protein [Asticcacaulis sp.]|uniref:HvfC/BufC N-terminal domain-containing protein n=1 Tax=Asticcacaulis sp. TaxID=1872648 RepID=UPI0025BC3844|nr:DNA-binding domain-containing protein [Asticcacaulis sp.]MCA1935449.1 DNA-binding domain-containing protein [Asticcacaulis sp.]